MTSNVIQHPCSSAVGHVNIVPRCLSLSLSGKKRAVFHPWFGGGGGGGGGYKSSIYFIQDFMKGVNVNK